MDIRTHLHLPNSSLCKSKSVTCRLWEFLSRWLSVGSISYWILYSLACFGYTSYTSASHQSLQYWCPDNSPPRTGPNQVMQIHFLQCLLVYSHPVYFWSPQTLPVNTSQRAFTHLLPCLFFLWMNAETQLGSHSVCLPALQFPFQVLQKPLHTLFQGCTKGPVIFHYSASIVLG